MGLLLLSALLQPILAKAEYGVDLLGASTFASGSPSWGYSDNSVCLNGYPNIGDANANSLTASRNAIESQKNILNVNASVYTFSLTVTANASYDGLYQIRMFDQLGNETSTGLTAIPAGSSREVTLRFYPKNTLSPITLSISGKSTLAINGCKGPVFSNPRLIEVAPPPKLSNYWMGSVNVYNLSSTSFNLVTYSQALQSCAVAYSYLIYMANPEGYLYLYRTIKLTPAQVSGSQRYLVTNVKPRTTYYAKEIAHGDLINCLDSDPPVTWPSWRTPGATSLATPSAPTLTSNSDNSINVSLGTSVTGASDYLFTLYASDSKTIVLSQLVSTGIVGGSVIIAGLKYGTTYYGGLVAKANGNTNESSGRSPLASVTTSADQSSPFTDTHCDLQPSVSSAVVKVSAPAGYCLARIETNTAITIPVGVTKADLLVVGGGGGGGAWVGGGGGGGGVTAVLDSPVSGTIQVRIGNGGAGGRYSVAGNFSGTAGGSSSFGDINSLGGGYGANWNLYAQGADSADLTIANGGGGSASTYSSGGVGAIRTGGSGLASGIAPYPTGGGAGAGANGGFANIGSLNSEGDRYCETYGGNGGNGLRDVNGISGSTGNYFGGGGGGSIHGYVIDNFYLDYCSGLAGSGGLGGGGAGLTPEDNPYGPQTGYSGLKNTGGGGGGVGHTSANASYGGAGGSGVVYIRWAKQSSISAALSLSANPRTVAYQSKVFLTATLSSGDGKVTFFQNGKRIAGCVGIRSSSQVATCSWKANFRNTVSITAVATQLVGGASLLSTPTVVTVVRRTTLR